MADALVVVDVWTELRESFPRRFAHDNLATFEGVAVVREVEGVVPYAKIDAAPIEAVCVERGVPERSWIGWSALYVFFEYLIHATILKRQLL
jgi:hypothetical protein